MFTQVHQFSTSFVMPNQLRIACLVAKASLQNKTREFYVYQVFIKINIILHMYMYYKTGARWMVGSSLTGSNQDCSSTDVWLLL